MMLFVPGASHSPLPCFHRQGCFWGVSVASSQTWGDARWESTSLVKIKPEKKGEGVVCAVVAERWKILFTAPHLHVGHGGDGRRGWATCNLPRATCSWCTFSGLASPLKEKAQGDFSFLKGQVTLLQDFQHFCYFSFLTKDVHVAL